MRSDQEAGKAKKKDGAIICDHNKPVNQITRREKDTAKQNNVTYKEQCTSAGDQNTHCSIQHKTAESTGSHQNKRNTIYQKRGHLLSNWFSPSITYKQSGSTKDKNSNKMNSG